MLLGYWNVLWTLFQTSKVQSFDNFVLIFWGGGDHCAIDPRVKSQARGQNNRSRALKWGIVHLCSSITFRDTTSFIEI